MIFLKGAGIGRQGRSCGLKTALCGLERTTGGFLCESDGPFCPDEAYRKPPVVRYIPYERFQPAAPPPASAIYPRYIPKNPFKNWKTIVLFLKKV